MAESYLIRRIPPQLWHQVKVLAAKRDISVRDLILEVLEKEIKEGEK